MDSCAGHHNESLYLNMLQSTEVPVNGGHS